MSARLALPLAAAAALLAPATAQACSCVQIDHQSWLRTQPAAVVGKVVKVGRSASPTEPITVVVRVSYSYRRALPHTLRLRTSASGASCGLEVRAGQRFAAFLGRQDGRWASNLCMKTTRAPLDAAARKLRLRKRAPLRARSAAVGVKACR